jgi:hypothetical protein
MIPNKKHQIFADEYVLTSDAIASISKGYRFNIVTAYKMRKQ